MFQGCEDYPIVLEYIEGIKRIPATLLVSKHSHIPPKKGYVSVGKKLEVGKTYYFDYSTHKKKNVHKMTIIKETERKGNHCFKYRVSFN